MTAKDVSVGLTYEVLVSDKLVPVTLDRVCEWGGWYGTNLATGHTVRIATAGRLRKQLDGETKRSEQRPQDIIIHTETQEAAMPTTTPAQRAKRAAKRTAKTNTTPTETQETTTVTKSTGKPKRKPTVKTAPKRPATLRITAPAAKPAAKPTTKTVSVKMKISGETKNAVKFEYTGTAKEPFVKAIYIAKDALMAMGEDTIVAPFEPYVPTGQQKPMPASAIRYSGDPATARDLYVNRAQAEKAGFTNDSRVSMDITAASEDTITLAISVA